MADALQAGIAAGQPAIRRIEPLDGHYLSGPGISASPSGAYALVNLRAGPDAVAAIGADLALALPMRPKTSAANAALAALWLGPDEWLILAGAGDDPTEVDAGAAVIVERIDKRASRNHSAVDVSHRFVAIALTGPNVAAVLASACPQDLRHGSFPVGACSRTVFAKAEVILWRRGEAEFELVCLRSFAPYVWALLVEAARAPAA